MKVLNTEGIKLLLTRMSRLQNGHVLQSALP
jgi:hypothetical protein